MSNRLLRRAGRLCALAASELRKLRARLLGDVAFGRGVEVGAGVRFRTFDGGTIWIGDDCEIWPGAVIEAKQAAIAIGPRSLVNTGTVIAARFGVTIGADALIAEHVTIRDANHGRRNGAPFNAQPMEGAPLTIGDSVWLGAKATVVGGINIGDRAVVGANAVVTKDLPGHATYVGAPARALLSAGR